MIALTVQLLLTRFSLPSQLEESVQVLTAQLEDARRQLGQLPFAGTSRFSLSAHSSELSQLQAENRYLREENADQRRQLYALRVSYGGPPDASATADLGASPPLRQSTSHSNRPRPLANVSMVMILTDMLHWSCSNCSRLFPQLIMMVQAQSLPALHSGRALLTSTLGLQVKTLARVWCLPLYVRSLCVSRTFESWRSSWLSPL